MSEFQKAILAAVQQIPYGKVASYGQIAAYIGVPRAARQVGWAMGALEHAQDFPWWRVLNKAGKITIKGNQFATATLQKQLLEAEGVAVSDAFTLDMARYNVKPDQKAMHITKLSQTTLEELY